MPSSLAGCRGQTTQTTEMVEPWPPVRVQELKVGGFEPISLGEKFSEIISINSEVKEKHR